MGTGGKTLAGCTSSKQVKACKALQQLTREMEVGRGSESLWLGGGQEMLTQVALKRCVRVTKQTSDRSGDS